MATEKYYGTGRRKSSVARVYVMPGNGNITINKRDIDEYFGLETLKVIVRQPLETIGATDKFDIKVSVHGGGYTGQAGAIRHGIARALVQADAENRPALKKAGFLTRDSRMIKLIQFPKIDDMVAYSWHKFYIFAWKHMNLFYLCIPKRIVLQKYTKLI